MALRVKRASKKDGRKTVIYISALFLVAGVSFGGIYAYNQLVGNAETPSVDEGFKANLIDESEPEPEPKPQTDSLETEVEAYLAGQVGIYGYHVIELDDGRSFGSRNEKVYTAASSIKVAMAAYIYNQIELGKINPNATLTYTSADYEGGTGSIQADAVGTKYKVSYLIERMIVASDNVATNILTRTYGRKTMDAYLVAEGITGIDIVNNDVTPKAMAELLSKIYNEEMISKENSNQLFEYMKKSITPTRLVAGVPASVEVAHKIGSWNGAISDIGVVFLEERAYAIAVYSEGVSWGEVTDSVIAGISKKVYDFETSF